ncbi:2Fe-2S iron-sulfur cluster binding domain-containing protein (plasmid) [Haloferax larsenii]|uniref:2Fe-2S iron-sulfur cluster binding domain-containing protein n=1 Tax=Haloferax larsenii TaxID=302484 RepID=A0ABY5RLI2_HALLR|nr:ferredoxin Fer [Haloferax larsenii]ELZ80427.1 ferredoxin [Haloferax larsenii JCM 13917]UVE52380.1 2Fe-2S iron-sulfur cluster binding domain-containing protein [Haloferax larsenii]
MDTPFEILGLDPDADEDDLVDAYRERIKAAHPDHGGSAEEFRRVRTAYEAIKEGYTAEDHAADLQRAAEETEAGEEREGETDTERTDSAAAAAGRPDGVRVEYLSYAALDDFGWTIHDDDLFEKAAEEDLRAEDYGEIFVSPRDTLLEAAQEHGLGWPYACRGGACANCAVAVVDGDLEMPANHVLSSEMMDNGIRLSCIGTPVTDDMKVVFDIKHLPGLEELRLPPQQARRMSSD